MAMVPFLVLASAGVAIMMIDIGHIAASKSRAQTAADASAIAGALRLRQQYQAANHTQVSKMAIEFAELNEPDFANVLVETDVVLGDWDPYVREFKVDTGHINAVLTIVHVDTDVLFMSIFGGSGQHVQALAIASFTVYEDSEPPFIDELTMPFLCTDKHELHAHIQAWDGYLGGSPGGSSGGNGNGSSNGN
jgi:hypothetical protein